MSKLNKDILYLIFEEFQDDSKSLFSCLMVNRLWCETVIPILWKYPWCYDISYSNKSYLFIIITSYLSDDIKELLTKQGIQLPLLSHHSLLFDYLSFCRSINIGTIDTITSIGSCLAYNKFLLEQEFYILFMKKFPELKYLDMKSIKHQIFYFPEAKHRFKSLCELECDISIDSSYFYGLAHISQHIERLIIINGLETEFNNLGIVKLIEVQKNLKYFEWKDKHPGFRSRVDPYKEILLTLEKKANIIDHLKIDFRYKDFTLQKVLPRFHKLKTLITWLGNFSEEELRMCVFHDLEVIKLDYYDLKTASIMIENSGRKIKKILLETYENDHYIGSNFNDDSLIFIRKVYEKCPLIEYLPLDFLPSKKHFNEFEKLLKVCQNLKSLVLFINDWSVIGVATKEKQLEIGEELLKVLVRSAPTNLKEFTFFDGFEFSLEALEEFFEKWRGRPALSIITVDPTYNREDYKKLVNKYKNNGVIKDFKCEYFISLTKHMDMMDS